MADLDERQRTDQSQGNTSQAQDNTSQAQNNTSQIQSYTSQAQDNTSQTQSYKEQRYTNDHTHGYTGQSYTNDQTQNNVSQNQKDTSREQLYASLEQRNVRQFSNEGFNGTEGFQEETAAEIAPPLTGAKQGSGTRNQGEAKEGSTGMGLAALALSILSLFVFPVLFGITGIVLGFIARGRGSKTGSWAITIGAISLLLGIFVLPFF
ncbi:DUF308 domain-containing protein [Niallia sp. XMNu-256]|uniref:DUF308 domain-containing protein n=1 Tax=Niallia sp. XMNu-256 TaxID=3082444 RepID=UPI0030D04E50